MPLSTVIHSFEAGVGGTLGHIAIVALGTMLGKIMAESGGATAIANTLIWWFGEKRVPLAMMFIWFVIGLARRTRTSLILVCLPLVAGLSVVNGLVPPHPAALLATTIYKADVGRFMG